MVCLPFQLANLVFEQLGVCDAQGSSPLRLSRVVPLEEMCGWLGLGWLVFQAIGPGPKSHLHLPHQKREEG